MNTSNPIPTFLIVENHYETAACDAWNGVLSYHPTRQDARAALWDIMHQACQDPQEEFIDAFEYWLDGQNWEPAPVVTWANDTLTLTYHDKIVTYEIQTTQQPVSVFQLLHI